MGTIPDNIFKLKWYDARGAPVPDVILYRLRVKKSVYFITILVLSNALISLVATAYNRFNFSINLITKIYDLWFFILIISGIFYLPYHPRHYGLNMNRLKYNLTIGLLIGGTGAFISIMIRIYLIKSGHKEFSFNLSTRSFILCSAYMVSCFLQDTLSRGFFQSYFVAVFRKNRWNRPISILLTSLIFAQFHYVYGFNLVIGSFIYCFITGFIYEKTRSVVGITIIHFLTGASMIHFTF